MATKSLNTTSCVDQPGKKGLPLNFSFLIFMVFVVLAYQAEVSSSESSSES